MEVGIVTLPLHTNYGGILQAWALQTVIERMGHESRHVFRDLLGPLILYKDMSPEEIAAFQRHTARFIGRYIRCDGTPLKDISPNRYDALVVGSDQIWRNRYTEFFHIGLRNAFLDFAKDWNVRRVAYAPSFGIDSWEAPESEIPACSELLRKFDAVSCREASGAAICRDVLGVEARVVADPTLLLGADDYGRLVDAGETEPPPGDLMAYVLDRDEEKDRILASVAKRFALRPFLMNDHPTIGFMLLLLVVKFLFGALCFASGAPGGTLYPLCILGTYLGAIFGSVAVNYLGFKPELWEEFVVIGMGRFGFSVATGLYNAGYEECNNRRIKLHNGKVESINLIGLANEINGKNNICAGRDR